MKTNNKKSTLLSKKNVKIETVKPNVPKPFNPLKTVSINRLVQMEFEPLVFYVKPFLPEGLSILAGKPKVGKSFFSLQLGITIAQGTRMMRKFNSQKSSVYYLPLEDNLRRLQDRVKKMLGKGNFPKNFLVPSRPERFPKLNNGGLECIKEIIASDKNVMVIIIDTYGKFINKNNGGNPNFAADYDALSPLQALAMSKHVSILLVHHNTKKEAIDPFDDIQGTMGTTASPDSLMVMRRNHGFVELFTRGRDFEEKKYVLRFDKERFRWCLADDMREYDLSIQQKQILKKFKSKPQKEFKLIEITKAVKDTSVQNTENKLKRLIEKELIVKTSRNCYKLNLEAYEEYDEKKIEQEAEGQEDTETEEE